MEASDRDINCEVPMSEWRESGSLCVAQKDGVSQFGIYITKNFAVFTGNLYDTGMWEAVHWHACRILGPVRVRKWKEDDVPQGDLL